MIQDEWDFLELQSQGYLKSESLVKEIKHPCTDVLEFLLERKLSLMTLQLTQQCNFRCKYCVYSEEANVRQRSLLNKEIMLFLEENDVSLLISLDGPQKINDKNRVFRNGRGTFDVVARNLELMKKEYPNYWKKIQISMVVDTDNDLDEKGEIVSALGMII